jgi:hypothetical protein
MSTSRNTNAYMRVYMQRYREVARLKYPSQQQRRREMGLDPVPLRKVSTPGFVRCERCDILTPATPCSICVAEWLLDELDG